VVLLDKPAQRHLHRALAVRLAILFKRGRLRHLAALVGCRRSACSPGSPAPAASSDHRPRVILDLIGEDGRDFLRLIDEL